MLLSRRYGYENSRRSHPSSKLSELDLDDLLHPAQAFDHPQDVVNDPI
jgi:hypothetical protein